MPGSSEGFDIDRLLTEARRLQIEHGAVAASPRHQLIVRAELDNPSALEDADPVRVPDGREAMGDQDDGAATSGLQEAVEDLRLAPYVQLSCGLVQDHHAGARLDPDTILSRPTARFRPRTGGRGSCPG